MTDFDDKKDSGLSQIQSVSPNGEITSTNISRFQAFKDSFKPAPKVEIDMTGMTDVEKAAIQTANSPLARKLKNRHLQMIAIGGSIGTGLFVGSGSALSKGGPASVLLAFIFNGAMIFATTQALGELAVIFPVSGAFSTFSTRFLDPSWGFAMGWNYALQWLVVFPLELVAASITLDYWETSVHPAVWVTIFWIVIVIINFFGVKGYGEAEFLFSLIKVIAVIGFIILGIVLVCGGGPNGGYIGGKYWQDPGAFHNGFKGFCSVLVTAAFSFAGTELVGLAAAETDNPRKHLPTACKQVIWRIALFYIISLTLIGLLVPYNEARLMGSSSVDATASPFVIAITNAGISGLPSVINAVIMIAVLSVGNSSIYGCSRTIASLADQGLAPKILGYIDREGRPLFGIVITSLFGLLAYVCASDKKDDVFNWLLALSGLSSIFTWGSICLCHIRFRRAMNVQGRDKDEIPFKSQVGVIGSWFGFGFNALVLCFTFWTSLFPIGSDPNPEDFFMSYLAVPVVLAFYIIHKLIYKPSIIRAKDMDLITGRREFDIDVLKQEIREEREALAKRNFFYRTYKFWC
ncbi:hypothetical protein D0Z00_004430 [Geotrichum galactomycetum]|uniref:Uncharacterized protein n=1 Tax=Geotrichum galactomycetum TaxID=27317 RepID=A0ACB6UYG4_9ASCO|nr:hypothetical protein D0Z00_004430 [Geotrichum candidum]